MVEAGYARFRAAPVRRPASEIAERMLSGTEGLRFDWSQAMPAAPIVMSPAAHRELTTAAGGLLALLARAVRSLGPTARHRATALGMDPRWNRFFVDQPREDALSTLVARPDALPTADGFQFIECNVSAAVGQLAEAHVLHRIGRAVDGPSTEAPVADPFDALADLLRDVCDRHGRGRRLTILGEQPHLEGDRRRPVYDLEVSFLRRRGLDVDLRSPTDHAAAPGPSPVLFRHMVPFDWTARGFDLDVFAAVCHADALVLLPHSSYLVANKKTMALLSQGQPWMSVRDRELVARYVPWTRIVSPRRVCFDGRDHDLPELLRRWPERFVLKEATSNAGQDVVVGRAATAGAWAAAIDEALASKNWVAQAYVAATRVPTTLIASPSREFVETEVEAVLSPFLIRGRAAGCVARYPLAEEVAVVNVNRGGVQSNVVVCR